MSEDVPGAVPASTPAVDPVGTVRDGGSPFPDGHKLASINRYWIKRTPPEDRDIECPWVALNHEADIQVMPNDLMDDKPVVPLADIAHVFAHP